MAMAIAADAAKAVQELKGKTLNGRQIQLELAAKRGTSDCRREQDQIHSC